MRARRDSYAGEVHTGKQRLWLFQPSAKRRAVATSLRLPKAVDYRASSTWAHQGEAQKTQEPFVMSLREEVVKRVTRPSWPVILV